MPIDNEYLRENELWIKAQENNVKQCEEAISYSLKEIELHKEAIAINGEFIVHYQEQIDKQKRIVEKYIKENQ